jgi:hypothetical protein
MTAHDTELGREQLVAWLKSDEAGAAWLSWVLPKVGNPASTVFRAAYASAQRKLRSLGRVGVLADAPRHWDGVDVARLWLLREGLVTVPREQWAAAVETLFESGELGEQVSLLRTLSGLPEAGLFSELGVAACRTNAVAVFEAISCENPYPTVYFDQLSFNQMAMKAVFLEVSLSRVRGLERRNNDELRRMANDYAAERRAAKRVVPSDLSLIDPSIGATS